MNEFRNLMIAKKLPPFIKYLITTYSEKKEEILNTYEKYPFIANSRNKWAFLKNDDLVTGIYHNANYTYEGYFYPLGSNVGIFGGMDKKASGNQWINGKAVGWWNMGNGTVRAQSAGAKDFKNQNYPILLKYSKHKYYINNVAKANESTSYNNTAIPINIGWLSVEEESFYGNVNYFFVLDENGKLLKYFVPTKIGFMDVVSGEIAKERWNKGTYTFLNEPRTIEYKYEDGLIIDGTIVVGADGTKNDIVIPYYITELGSQCFYQSNISSITFNSNNITEIPQRFVAECRRILNITLPNTITKINNFAFNKTVFTSITIPDSVEYIGSGVFQQSSLENITIGKKCKEIGNMISNESLVFHSCPLKEIHFRSEIPPRIIGTDNFRQCPSDFKVYVPIGTLDAYKTAQNYPSPTTYEYIEEEII